MILVDSSVWIDYFNGVNRWQTDALDHLLSTTTLLMGDLILAEVLQGFRRKKDFETANQLLSSLPFRAMGGYQVALQSALNYRRLRKSGITVRKTIDVFIATFCIIEGISLLHNDRDFKPLEVHCGLATYTPPR
ncbi:MAG: PIN domain nuclease [Desulfosarcinaceae bacterium]|nr:PIN domain nuclease [Desulfosarcinaceae bacterium]